MYVSKQLAVSESFRLFHLLIVCRRQHGMDHSQANISAVLEKT